MATPEWLEEIDHTADTGIIVWARNRKELFARAAWGMFSVITNMDTVRPEKKTAISVDATDSEALMVRWLSELNFQHVTEHKLFCGFEILELSDKKLTAEVHGENINHSRHSIYTEIKAVTFHGLRIERKKDRWRTQIIFDI